MTFELTWLSSMLSCACWSGECALRAHKRLARTVSRSEGDCVHTKLLFQIEKGAIFQEFFDAKGRSVSTLDGEIFAKKL